MRAVAERRPMDGADSRIPDDLRAELPRPLWLYPHGNRCGNAR